MKKMVCWVVGVLVGWLALCDFVAVAQEIPAAKVSDHRDTTLALISQSALPESCQLLLSEANAWHLDRLNLFQYLGHSSVLDAALAQTNHEVISSLIGPVASRVCDFLAVDVPSKYHAIEQVAHIATSPASASQPEAKPQARSLEKALAPSTFLAIQQSGGKQSAGELYGSIMTAIALMAVFRGMFARIWCDNFFQKEREAWVGEGDEVENHLSIDANFLKADWEESTLAQMAERSATKAAKNGDKDELAPPEEREKNRLGGIHRLAKDLLSWHYESNWPPTTGGDWQGPTDPFDTIREHHEPAPHYIRLYCQEMHYSIGWRAMNLMHGLFKTATKKATELKKQALDKAKQQMKQEDKSKKK